MKTLASHRRLPNLPMKWRKDQMSRTDSQKNNQRNMLDGSANTGGAEPRGGSPGACIFKRQKQKYKDFYVAAGQNIK